MKFWPLLAISLALPLTGSAATIAGLFNTGVDGTGTPLSANSVDPHYTDANSNNNVAPDTSQGAGYLGGIYTLDYMISFDLTGFDPASVAIAGRWSTDNSGLDILVNGHSTGFSSPSYSALTPFSLSGGSGFFTSGINTLDFKWSNSGGPGGVAIVFDRSSADPGSTGAPEPGSMILFGAGLVAVALIGRRKLAKQQ
jgi:hypothetical protein